jgi:hypothetical protein
MSAAGRAGACLEEWLPVVLAALLDAAEWRTLLAGEWGARRVEYLEQAAAYRQLARDLAAGVRP